MLMVTKSYYDELVEKLKAWNKAYYQEDKPEVDDALYDAQIKELEKIVHPLVGQDRQEFISKAEQEGHAFVLLDVPLIFETGGEKNFDHIIVVSAPKDVQKKRVLAREDMTEEKFEAILARQLPDAEKRERADFVIDTNCSEEETFDQVKALVEKLKGA